MGHTRSKNSLGCSGEQRKDTETRLITKALLKNKCLNRRQLSDVTQLEIATLCRATFNMRKLGMLVIDRYSYCPITGKLVMFFALPAKAGGSHE